jgi:hypothetical protein
LVRKDYLHVKIDLPSFQFEVHTKEPHRALPELRRILEAVKFDEQALYEEEAITHLREQLSQTFIENAQVMAVVKRLLHQEEDYRVATVPIDRTATIDIDEEARDVRVERATVRRATARLTEGIPTKDVKHGIVHINGTVAPDDRVLIIDHIHTRMPTAQLRAFQSPGTSQQVVVECVFFGPFEDDA